MNSREPDCKKNVIFHECSHVAACHAALFWLKNSKIEKRACSHSVLGVLCALAVQFRAVALKFPREGCSYVHTRKKLLAVSSQLLACAKVARSVQGMVPALLLRTWSEPVAT
jgi:hypothetical protein